MDSDGWGGVGWWDENPSLWVDVCLTAVDGARLLAKRIHRRRRKKKKPLEVQVQVAGYMHTLAVSCLALHTVVQMYKLPNLQSATSGLPTYIHKYIPIPTPTIRAGPTERDGIDKIDSRRESTYLLLLSSCLCAETFWPVQNRDTVYGRTRSCLVDSSRVVSCGVASHRSQGNLWRWTVRSAWQTARSLLAETTGRRDATRRGG